MMKKAIKKLIIASAMFGTIFSVNTSEAAVLMGDANGDGKVDAKDVQMMEDYQNGKNVYIYRTNADVYKQDGKITSGDIFLLQHYIKNFGDADGNGKINNADVDYILNLIANRGKKNYEFLCDLNGDGEIDVSDFVKAKKIVDGKISTVDSKFANQVLGGVGHSPEGVITSFSSPANNQITLTGKVWDRDAMDKPVTLQVYIGNDLGGSARFTVAPNKTFTYTYNVKNVPGKQAYTVYAIDEYGNNRKDAKIASGTVYVNGNFEHRPQGVITSFYSPAANQITLTGKVYDMDDMNKNIELHVYIGNDLGGSDKFTVCPNQEFTHTYNVKNVPGKQAYTVWAIDDYGPNRENYVIARGTVDVKTTPVPPPPTPTATTYRVSTNSLNLNLRSGMSNTASIIAKMPKGSIVTGSDQGNGWARVTYNGMTGYASMQYLSPAQPPVPPPTPVGDVKSKLRYAVFNDSSARITCDFDGYVNTKGRHEGIDMVLYHKAPVYSAISGTVIRTGGDYNTVAIYDSTHDKTVIYLHFNSIAVSNGSYVNKGSLIGYQGSKGASASHVHLEVRNGRRTSAAKSVNDYTLDNPNPYNYWNAVL